MIPQDVKVLIAIPNLEGPKAENSSCVATYWGKHKYPSQINYINDTYIHTARNRATQMAVESGATHLMFLDSDQTFPPGGIDTLVERDKDVIGGLYFGRLQPKPIVLRIDPEDKMVKVQDKIPTWTEPFKADIVGTGFMLIKTEVFKKMKPPYFTYTDCKEFGLTSPEFPKNEVGEDVYFCLKCGQNNIEVWVDPTIPIGHVGRRIYTRRDYELFYSEGGEKFYDSKLW